MNSLTRMMCAMFLAGAMVAASGCGEQATPKSETGSASSPAVAQTKVHDHSGWWCDEHGIPEAECSMCSPKVAAACRKKGDWCDKHDRARSQCFLCEPALQDKFAAKYRAKYGKEPPPITE